MSKQFLKFALVGLTSTITTYAVLITAVEGFGANAVGASIVGYALGIVVNYLLNYRYTFGSNKKHSIAVPKFLVVMGIGMILNAGIMFAGVNGLAMHYMLAQLAAVALVLLWSFTVNRFWTFAE